MCWLAALNAAGCNNQPGCPGAALSGVYTFPIGGAVEDGRCTVEAFETLDGRARRLSCYPRQDTCWCQGGTEPGVYTVEVYDAEQQQLLDVARIEVLPDCKTARQLEAFSGFGGMAGHSGASQAGTAGQSQ